MGANVDVKTTDGYTLRLFCIGFTRKQDMSTKKTAYAQAGQVRNENDAERSFRKFKLVCEEVQGKNCLTNFHGMGLTTDKLRSMVKKWQTLIEANCDVKTTDGYTLRLFCIGFTRKQEMSTKKTAYAQAG